MLVRQHGSVDLQRNPHIAADEFKLLQLLQTAGLATPMPYYLDQAEWAGDDRTEKTMRAGHHLLITQAFEQL